LGVAERIMRSSEGHISVLRTHSHSCCSVVEVNHPIAYGSGLGDSTHLVLSCLCVFCCAVPKKEEEGQALRSLRWGREVFQPPLSLTEITAMSRVKRFSCDFSCVARCYRCMTASIWMSPRARTHPAQSYGAVRQCDADG
jgi:hypothetical protein